MLSPSRLVCSLFLFSLVFGAFNTTAHAMLPRESSSKVEDHERLERKPSKISWHDPAAETPTAEETEKLEDRFDLVKTKTRIIEQELLDLDSNENPSLEDPHGLIKAILKDNKEEQKILSSDFVNFRYNRWDTLENLTLLNLEDRLYELETEIDFCELSVMVAKKNQVKPKRQAIVEKTADLREALPPATAAQAREELPKASTPCTRIDPRKPLSSSIPAAHIDPKKPPAHFATWAARLPLFSSTRTETHQAATEPRSDVSVQKPDIIQRISSLSPDTCSINSVFHAISHTKLQHFFHPNAILENFLPIRDSSPTAFLRKLLDEFNDSNRDAVQGEWILGSESQREVIFSLNQIKDRPERLSRIIRRNLRVLNQGDTRFKDHRLLKNDPDTLIFHLNRAGINGTNSETLSHTVVVPDIDLSLPVVENLSMSYGGQLRYRLMGIIAFVGPLSNPTHCQYIDFGSNGHRSDDEAVISIYHDNDPVQKYAFSGTNEELIQNKKFEPLFRGSSLFFYEKISTPSKGRGNSFVRDDRKKIDLR